jgi:hypothetical protein
MRRSERLIGGFEARDIVDRKSAFETDWFGKENQIVLIIPAYMHL